MHERACRAQRACRAGALALTLTACASCAPHAAGESSPKGGALASPPATQVRTALPSASPPPGPTASPVKVTVSGRKVGSQYVVGTEMKGNRKVYVLRADSESGQYFGGDTGSSDFVNPHVTFFGKHGQRLIADAPFGTAVAKEKSLRMRGGVHARTADGKTLTSDTLRYADPNETVYGDGNVVLTSPSGDRLEGEHLVWNLRTGHIDVTGSGAAT